MSDTAGADRASVLQPLAARRCGTCARWGGPRAPAPEAAAVRLAAETVSGPCLGGPWDGSERRARAACGRWQAWPAVPTESAR